MPLLIESSFIRRPRLDGSRRFFTLPFKMGESSSESPARRYVALAFLPVALAGGALAFLYLYQQKAEDRRDTWQKPKEIFDALGITRGMQVAEWNPPDTYFLERLSRRVGSEGKVYAIRASQQVAEFIRTRLPEVRVVEEPPAGLDAVLLLHLTPGDKDAGDLEKSLQAARRGLGEQGSLGLIGVRSEELSGFIAADEAARLAARSGFTFLREERFVDRQFLLVLRKGEGS